jgi:hypothetical protein
MYYYAPEDQVKSRLFLDVVVTQSTAILELFTSEDESLLVRGNTVGANTVCQPFAPCERRRQRTLPCPGFWP